LKDLPEPDEQANVSIIAILSYEKIFVGGLMIENWVIVD
jgi:hypothetical protein